MNKIDLISKAYQSLQEEACNAIATCDGKGSFTKDRWEKEIGFGITRVLSGGDKISKGAINFSSVRGHMNDRLRRALGVEADQFAATGISSIFHGNNPFIPTIHMNVRYFAMDNGERWFGGGIDLTPVYVVTEEASWFHQQLKYACDALGPGYYEKFKPWADDYFYLPHRDETRGVGGIFFDKMVPGNPLPFDDWFSFTKTLVHLYVRIYSRLMQDNANKPFTENNEKWQALRWGRYAEFNLIYDRGTRFGLESGGNTESILVSLPPGVQWEYNYQPLPGSAEEKTLECLKKGIDWEKGRHF